MPIYLILGVSLYCAAFVFYTWGVWAERKSGRLQLRHLKVFVLGVSVDGLATVFTILAVGGIVLTAHALFGFAALVLMALHTLFAAYVLSKRDEQWILKFHRLSLFVWGFWSLSFFTGMGLGIGKMG